MSLTRTFHFLKQDPDEIDMKVIQNVVEASEPLAALNDAEQSGTERDRSS